MSFFRLTGAGLLGALALLVQPAAPSAAAPVRAAAAQPAHERLLPLQGGRNFRDLGGYRAADGRTVKWRILFRSGEMHELTAQDYAYLNRLGIRTVCDFRDRHERASQPTLWPAGDAPTTFAEDYESAQVGLMPSMDKLTPQKARAMMLAHYPQMLTTFAPQYRRMFQELLAGHAPLAFHCSGGKDRTGVASALLLTALGVPRATVIADYELTNRYLPANDPQVMKAPTAQVFARLPAPVRRELSRADAAYIKAMFARLDAHKDGARGYLRDEMGLSDADIARLRDLYLERAGR